MVSPTDIEKTNLESHVELCALRYSALEGRLDNIEKKVGTLQELIEKSNSSMIKVMIGTAGTVIAGVLSVIVTIMLKG
jgi:tetrahydromethanopterin S-methyltransferase subunit G